MPHRPNAYDPTWKANISYRGSGFKKADELLELDDERAKISSSPRMKMDIANSCIELVRQKATLSDSDSDD